MADQTEHDIEVDFDRSDCMVWFHVNGEPWDALSVSLPRPQRVDGGWICRECLDGPPVVFATLAHLWAHHFVIPYNRLLRRIERSTIIYEGEADRMTWIELHDPEAPK